MAKFDDGRGHRSDKYQYVLMEVSCSHEVIGRFDNSHSISAHLNPFEYDERYFDLEERLKARTRELMDGYLTKRQTEVINLLYQGYTQQEIAKILGCNQSSITKSLNGNQAYNTTFGKTADKVYGGSVNKLRKIFLKDEEINLLLQQMEECIYEKY